MTAQTLKNFDHALFGYADGHRQLASTIRLPSQDMYHLSAASDLASEVKLDPAGSYVTGLPLEESRRFALIRTWAAPEMPRPGCVWSHVLLLDQSVMSAQADLSIFFSLFRDPREVGRSFYSRLLTLDVGGTAQAPPSERRGDMIVDIIDAYYSHRPTFLAASATAEAIEGAIAAVWSQQWPRLRTGFSFRTARLGSSRRRSTKYDVQVASPESAGISSRAPWAVAAAADAGSDVVTPLRRFLWRYGRDIRYPRDRFRLLIETHLAGIGAEHLPMLTAMKVFEALEEADDGAILKNDILGFGTTSLSICPPVAFFDMLRLLDLRGTDAGVDVREIERRFGTIPDLEAAAVSDFAFDPGNRLALLREPIFEWSVARADEQFVEAVTTPTLRLNILLRRPDLVTARTVANLSSEALARLFETYGVTAPGRMAVYVAVRRDLGEKSRDMLSLAPELVAASAIAAAREGSLNDAWLRPIANVRDTLLATDLLQHARTLSDVTMIAGLLGLSQGVFPIGISAANWASRWGALEHDVSHQDVLDIEAGLFLAALGEPSTAGWELIAAVLPELRGSINRQPLGGEARRILDLALPFLGYDNWDLNRRIMLALHSLHRRAPPCEDLLSRAGVVGAEAEFVRLGPREEFKKKGGFFWWLG